MVILEVVKSLNDKIAIVPISYKLKPRTKNVKKKPESSSSWGLEFFLERERLLSRIPVNSTVGSLRDKKASCSTRSSLRVGTGFVSFRQAPRGRGFSLLGFY